MALGALSAVAILSLAAARTDGVGEQRWTAALQAADAQPDPLARARARVEALYGAGDLPGALREALSGLRDGGDDPALLRRACELASALRMTQIAEDHAARLSRVLAGRAVEPGPREWWLAEARRLERGANELRQRDERLSAATRRARVLSLGSLAAIALFLVLLARER